MTSYACFLIAPAFAPSLTGASVDFSDRPALLAPPKLLPNVGVLVPLIEFDSFRSPHNAFFFFEPLIFFHAPPPFCMLSPLLTFPRESSSSLPLRNYSVLILNITSD